jgi:hypothetical protein
MRKQYYFEVRFNDGTKLRTDALGRKASEAMYKIYLRDMILLNVKSIAWGIA